MHCSTCTVLFNCCTAHAKESRTLLINLCSKPEKARNCFNVIILSRNTEAHGRKQAACFHSLLPSLLSSFPWLERGLAPPYLNWGRLNSRLSKMKATEILLELQPFSVLIIFYILSPLPLSFIKSPYWFLLSVPLPALPLVAQMLTGI